MLLTACTLREDVRNIRSRALTSHEHRNGTWDRKPVRHQKGQSPHELKCVDYVKKNKAFLGYHQEEAGEKGQRLQATSIQSTGCRSAEPQYSQKEWFSHGKCGRIKVRQAMNLKMGILKNPDISINTSIQFSANYISWINKCDYISSDQGHLRSRWHWKEPYHQI